MTSIHLASLLGILESCHLAFWVTPFHVRALQILLIQTLNYHQFNYVCPIVPNPLS